MKIILWDHPRVCGEKEYMMRPFTSTVGSPPRVRGKASPTGQRLEPVGDHPRVCGEKKRRWNALKRLVGSPPRVRGKDTWNNVTASNARITPACAGKSLSFHLSSQSFQDHPRVCGEKCVSLPERVKVLGSPPRVRGKACSDPATPFKVGITPACAGKRSRSSEEPYRLKDHPRVCGEKRRRRKRPPCG